LPGSDTTFALTKLLFGEGTSGQWEALGFNIDGLVSTAVSADVCQTNSGGSAATAYPDGNNGIDNSFGRNVLPLMLSLFPSWVTDVNVGLQDGSFNMLLKSYCLPPTGDVPVLTTKLFEGTALGAIPQFDGTDMWPVSPALLANPTDPESSTITFDMSSVTGTTFDSGKHQTVVLALPFGPSTRFRLTLHAAQVTMTLAADRKSATSGIIGGVLNTEELVAEVKKVGYSIGLCDSPLLANLLTSIRQASDIVADGSQDPAKMCNGISIGLGFEMKEVQRGAVGPVVPVAMSCP
jgi:hypothetical protein